MTTRAIGEEDPNFNPPGVMNTPPELRMTTMAVGEEDGSGMGVIRNDLKTNITTAAVIPSEGGDPRPPILGDPRPPMEGDLNKVGFTTLRGDMSVPIGGKNQTQSGITTAAVIPSEGGDPRPPTGGSALPLPQNPNAGVGKFRQPGDMGRYVAFNDPGQPGYGFSNQNDYNASINSGTTTMAVGEEDNVAPQPTNTLTDPSEFIQAQVGAAVMQPTLPQGTATLPNLALQQSTAATEQTTPGLTGTVTAATPTATAIPTVTPTAVGSAATIAAQAPVTAPNYSAVTGATTPQMAAAQGTVTQPMVAAQEDLTALPPEATVQGQLANISEAINKSVTDGTPIPAFASGAKRLVDAAMQQRGLGASSIAAEALAQGILTASVPIAQQDADFYKQAVFANLSNRQQAAVTNANAYLQMDMANLSNNQQANLTNIQLRQQTMLSDQAASNAALQFNAQSDSQTDQFFASLTNQINTNNSQRADAMNQFSASETNRIAGQNANNAIAVGEANAQREATINQFNSQLEDQRQRFNIENQRVIDQSNVAWRRSVNTANTVSINAANQTDAQNLLNISNFGLSALWQQWRDEASWINTASENESDRAHNIAVAALERTTEMELLNQESKNELNGLLGQLGMKIFSNIAL